MHALRPARFLQGVLGLLYYHLRTKDTDETYMATTPNLQARCGIPIRDLLCFAMAQFQECQKKQKMVLCKNKDVQNKLSRLTWAIKCPDPDPREPN